MANEELEKRLDQLMTQNEAFRVQLSESHSASEALRKSIEELNKRYDIDRYALTEQLTVSNAKVERLEAQCAAQGDWERKVRAAVGTN